MQGLQVRRAAMAAIAIDMIDFNPIVVVKEQPTGGTAPTLLFEQCRQSRTDPWVPSLSRAPIDPVPIIGTAVAPDFDMPGDGDLTAQVEVPGMRSEWPTWQRKRRVPSRCGIAVSPKGWFWSGDVGVPNYGSSPSEGVEASIDGLAHTDAVVVCPAPDGRG